MPLALKRKKSSPPLAVVAGSAAPTPKRTVGQKAHLTRAAILAEALNAFVDPGGSLNMEKLATRLKVYSRTLYSPFPKGQAQIITTLVSAALDRAAVPLLHGESGEAYLDRLFRHARGVFAAHPGLAKFVPRELAEDLLVSAALSERVLGTLSDLGVPPNRRADALAAVMASLSGFVSAEFPTGVESQGLEQRQIMFEGLPDHVYPELTAAKAMLIDALAMKSAEDKAQGEKRASAHAAFVVAGLKSFAISSGKLKG